jgi:hypothetical protein
MTYTNEIEVEVDFSDVDPNLLDESKSVDEQSITIVTTSEDKKSLDGNLSDDLSEKESELDLKDNELKPSVAGRAARFFRKKS